MGEFFSLALSADFSARGECGMWHPAFAWLYVLSQVLIFAAYMVLPVVIWLAYLRGRSGDVIHITRKQVAWARWMFGLFIFFCGIGHLEGVLSFFKPQYHLYALWHFATAVVSWGAVFVAARLGVRLIPGI